MKTCDEMMNSLYERRAQYVTAQRKKKKVLASAGATLCAVSLLGGSVWYLNRPQHDIPVIPTPDENEVTTTVDVPTEGENTTTTTTVNTTAGTTTDGGVVAPTTVTTVVPTTTAKPTTGKTEPSKTPTTTGAKDKLLITGIETIDDDTLDQMPTGLFKAGEISPLLKQAMEQYKDTDAVYAVLVAINPKYNQKLVEDFDEAVDALLQSDEMVKLAEQRDLAREEWQAIDEERKANIGNEEWAAEFLADYVTKEETYRSLRSQYYKRELDFKLAYWSARADEAVEALAKFSDIEPIPLEGRWKEDLEKNEKAVLSYVLSAAYGTKKSDGSLSCYGYAAVLSADEILELSECGSYMFWLDSYDEEAYMDYLNDWV